MTDKPQDPGETFNGGRDTSPIGDVDQIGLENWWTGDKSPHRPHERGMLGAAIRRVRHWLDARRGTGTAAPEPGR